MNLRRDPFERAEFNSNTYWDWMVDHVPQMYMMQAVVAGEIERFAKFPPRQKPASFNLDDGAGAGAAPRLSRSSYSGGARHWRASGENTSCLRFNVPGSTFNSFDLEH